MSSAVMIGILVAGGVYLLLQRSLLRMTLGFILLGHAANLALLASGVLSRRGPSLLGDADAATAADPLPQAFVLTAIVITFGITVYLFAISASGGDDDEAPEALEGPGHDASGLDASGLDATEASGSGPRSAEVPPTPNGGPA